MKEPELETDSTAFDFDAIVRDMLTPKRYERKHARPELWTERAELAFAGGRVAYWSTGVGPVVLLAHGWEGDHNDFDAFVEPLVARGRRVLAPDLPAHGESSGSMASLYDFRNALRALGERAGPIEAAIAHSAGAPAVAMALADGMLAQRVVLLAPPRNYERFARWFAGEAGISEDALVAAFAARGIDTAQLDLPSTAATLDVPALIAHSADDRVTQFSGGRAVADAWRGSEFLALDGLGHSRILRDPTTVEAVVAFATNSRNVP